MRLVGQSDVAPIDPRERSERSPVRFSQINSQFDTKRVDIDRATDAEKA
jgi:hypothetical protein